MSWTSTAEHYRLLNHGVASRLVSLHSARLLVHSVDFEPGGAMQHDGDWGGTAAVLIGRTPSTQPARLNALGRSDIYKRIIRNRDSSDASVGLVLSGTGLLPCSDCPGGSRDAN